jgi:hypothetical protein
MYHVNTKVNANCEHIMSELQRGTANQTELSSRLRMYGYDVTVSLQILVNKGMVERGSDYRFSISTAAHARDSSATLPRRACRAVNHLSHKYHVKMRGKMGIITRKDESNRLADLARDKQDAEASAVMGLAEVVK